MVNTCKKLKVEELNIDFAQSSGNPQACISLGKSFAKTSVWVLVSATVTNCQSQNPIESCQHVCTNSKGEFKVNIPLNTESLELKMKIKLGSNYSCTCGKCSDYLKVNGQYAPYGEYDLVWRTYNGSENNLVDPRRGARDQALLRKAEPAYGDGPTGGNQLAVRGPNNPNPRLVSNCICRSDGDFPNTLGLTDIVWGFGQFLDHEIDLTEGGDGEEANIITPTLLEDPTEEYPEHTIKFTRSAIVPGSSPRQQPNQISSYIDATNVYGYETHRAFALRKLDGSGKLKTGDADNGEKILPYNVYGLPNAGNGQSSDELFLGGDIRANENILLMGFHVLFAREHNRLCDLIVAERPAWAGKDELIFQHARRTVTGIMTNITLREFVPALLGDDALEAYGGYDDTVDTGVANEFSTAGYRLGHSMLSSDLKIGETGTRALRDSFFNPEWTQANGVESVLHGASKQVMQQIDGKVVDDIRDFLFGPPQAMMMLDLAVLNIQRGRDHGLPGYNAVRVAYGLSAVSGFAEITGNTGIQAKLEELYDHPDHIDPWVGCIVEDHVTGAAVGETLFAILKDQFTRLRDGDRFFFENDNALSDDEKAAIRNTRLSDVILRNCPSLVGKIQADVFHL